MLELKGYSAGGWQQIVLPGELALIFAQDTEFYLTGGTCLNRFYYEKRLSDDLDFFYQSRASLFGPAQPILIQTSLPFVMPQHSMV